MKRDVIKGLSLLEGSFPVDHLNPALIHLCHYAHQTDRVGLLEWFSMFAFERNNKKVKSMVKHTANPISALVNNVELDISTRKDVLVENQISDLRNEPIHVTVRIRCFELSDKEKRDMSALSRTISFRSLQKFKTCNLLGVHFRSGEWGCRRCGSVITTIYQGVSRYCFVNGFYKVRGTRVVFASVTWLSIPVYPCHPCKLVVKVKLLTPRQQTRYRSVISVNKIDPCTVSVIPDSDGIHFYMLRERGIDRTI